MVRESSSGGAEAHKAVQERTRPYGTVRRETGVRARHERPAAAAAAEPGLGTERAGSGRHPEAPAAPGGEKPKKAKRPKRTGWRRAIPTWRMTLGGVVVLVALLIGAFYLGYSLVKIPPTNALAMKQSNVYLYADGSQLARDGEVNRENVGLAQVSKNAQHAVLAAEDRDFYTESAVDPKAMVRAAWNTATGKGTQSGSTITQQYVKNYYLGQEQTVTRKVKEFFISIKLDREESKDEILEGYLNTSYFGRNAYGIQAAAQAYYGKDAADLDASRGRLPRRAAERAERVRRRGAPGEQGLGAGPLELRPRRHGQEGLAHPGRAHRHEVPHAEGGHGLNEHVRTAWLHRRRDQGLPHHQQDHRRGHPRSGRLPHHDHPAEEQAGRLREVRQRPTHVQARQEEPQGRQLRTRGRGFSRPQDRQNRRDVRRHRLREAVHERRDPRRLPSRLHLQAVRPHLRDPERLADPGRPGHHAQHLLRRHQQAPRGRLERRLVRARERGRGLLRRHHRPHRDRQVRQLGVRADGGRRRPHEGQADRRRPRHPVRHPRPDRHPVDRARPVHRERPRHGGGLRHHRQPR